MIGPMLQHIHRQDPVLSSGSKSVGSDSISTASAHMRRMTSFLRRSYGDRSGACVVEQDLLDQGSAMISLVVLTSMPTSTVCLVAEVTLMLIVMSGRLHVG